MDNNIVYYDLEDCPHCRGVGQLMHEGGWNCYVECLDCGAQTTFVDYDDAGSKEEAEQAVVRLYCPFIYIAIAINTIAVSTIAAAIGTEPEE